MRRLGPFTVTDVEADAAPPGFFTVMPSFPVLMNKLAGTMAVIEVAVPAVTVNAVVPE